jgi:hypothetical protein
MIKAVYILMYAPLLIFAPAVGNAEHMNEYQWAAFIMWISVMVLVAIVASVAFKSVWLRDGFAGINKILEDHEAIRFLASVMSFFFLEIYIGLHASEFSGLYPHENYKYYLAFSGCVGTGGYAVFEKIIKSKYANHLIDNMKKDEKH